MGEWSPGGGGGGGSGGFQPDNSTVTLNSSNKLQVPILVGTRYVNLKAQGCVGDGVADDTVAFQNAIAAAGNFGAIYCPFGSYKVSDQGGGFCLDISSYSGLRFFGESGGVRCNPGNVGGGTTIFTSSANSLIFNAQSPALNHYGPSWERLRIEARAANTTCVHIDSYNNWAFLGEGTLHGNAGTTTGRGLIVSDVNGGDASYGVIENWNIHRNLKGIEAIGSTFAHCKGLYLESNVTNHILVDLQAGAVDWRIDGKFEGNGTTGSIAVQIASGGNHITGNIESPLTGVNLTALGSPAYSGNKIEMYLHGVGSGTAIVIGANRERDIINCSMDNWGTNISDSSPTDGSGAVIFPTRSDGARTGEFMRISGTSFADTSAAPGGTGWATGSQAWQNGTGIFVWTGAGWTQVTVP